MVEPDMTDTPPTGSPNPAPKLEDGSPAPVRGAPSGGDGGGKGAGAAATRGLFPNPVPRWRTRRIALLATGLVTLLAAALGVAYWHANLGFIKTDNAQTAGDLAPVSPMIIGTVLRVLVVENQQVTDGAVLVELDPTDYRLALDHARAQLTAARAQAEAARAALAAQEQQFAASLNVAQAGLQASRPRLPQAQAQLSMQDQTTRSQVAQAQAQVTTAQANVQAAKTDLDTATRTIARDRELWTQGAIAAQQVDADTAAYQSALARYQAAQDGLRGALATLASAVAGRQQVTVASQAVEASRGEIAQSVAQVQQAATGAALVRQRAQELAVAEAQVASAADAVESASVNLDRTLIRAPADGWVTNRTVQIGQVVQPNQPLLSVALAQRVWVVANIKETQVGAVRAGDPVRITIDAFRGRVFRGHVESIGAATGSTTALLPPDNATGNFVKVVQLVPVRIAIDSAQSREVRIPLGLSAEVAIDTRRMGR
jgi:membrane fusion protein (multidrug efflux system)